MQANLNAAYETWGVYVKYRNKYWKIITVENETIALRVMRVGEFKNGDVVIITERNEKGMVDIRFGW